MRNLDKVTISTTEPKGSNVVWVNPKTLELKVFSNGKWRPIGGGDNVVTTDILEQLLQESSTITSKADKIPLIEHGTSDTTFTLPPNEFHTWGVVSELNLTLGTPEEGVYNEYMFEFTSGATATALSLPSSILWQDVPDIEANMKYQVSIVNNVGLIVGVEVTV